MSFIGRPPSPFDKEDTLPLVVLPVEPDLAALGYALRNPATWPKGFVWNYENCRTCAVALSFALWPSIGRHPGWWRTRTLPNTTYNRYHLSAVARGFAIPFEVANRIFFEANPDIDMVDVTPEHVAAQIENYYIALSRL